MGRKRRIVEHIAIAKEDKTSNACPNAMGAVNDENNVKHNSNGVVRLEKNSRVPNFAVRQYERLKNPVSPDPGVKPVEEQVNLVENEKDEALHSQDNNLGDSREKNMERELQVEQDTTLPEVKEKSLEEKIDHLVRAVDEFKSKIEALMEENYELVRKLEFARGKIAAYELNAVDASKKLTLASSLGKATEVAAYISHQAVQKSIPAPPPTLISDADYYDDPKRKNTNKKKKAKR